MVQNLWTTSFFHASPPPYHLVKICLLYSHWCFWPFPLSIQFHALLFVLIAVFHKNTPNTGCPVLGVHISIGGTYQKWGGSFFVRQLLLFICCVPCACRQFRSALFLPCERAFLPAAFVARLSREWPFVLPKSRTLPGKKHRKAASAISSAVSYRFYNVFCKKGFTNEFQKHII